MPLSTPATRLYALDVACTRLYLVLVRTVLGLVHDDCDILLGWSIAEELGWSLHGVKSVIEWDRCSFTDGRLTSLNLDSLRLTHLPKSIGRLTALKEFTCCHNQLESLPDSIGRLTALRKLWTHNNRLVRLPESIGSLVQLRELWVSHNWLPTLPESIGQLVSLRDLGCGNNLLSSFPGSLSRCTSLRRFWAQSNPFESSPVLPPGCMFL